MTYDEHNPKRTKILPMTCAPGRAFQVTIWSSENMGKKSWVPELSEVCADMVDVSKMTIVLADLDFKKMTFTKLFT